MSDALAFARAAGLPTVVDPGRPDHDRHVLLETAFNVRDLGGIPGDAGRRVRTGVLYRGDGIHRVGAADVALLQEREIRTVLDLRTDAELQRHGVYGGGDGVLHHHLPLLRETWDARALDPAADGDEAADFLAARYAEILDEGAEGIAIALGLIADPANRAVLFHCAAGKDRTGVLAIVVLALLGVDDEQVADDYHLTQHGTARWLAWASTADPDLLEAMATQPPAYLAAPRDAALVTLDAVRRRHGSVEAYVAGIGVQDATVERLRSTLLD